MKIEKKLRDESDLTNKRILEDGQELKANLMAEYCTSSKEAASKRIYKRKSVIITMCCILVCFLSVGIVLPIVLRNDGPTVYLKKNEVSNSISLENIYKVIDMQIDENNYDVTMPTIVHDSISNDILYYTVKIDSKTVFPRGDVYFVNNDNYTLFDEKYESICKWNDINVFYTVSPGSLTDIPSVRVAGVVEYAQFRIYFIYTDIDLGEQVTPINFLNSLFL